MHDELQTAGSDWLGPPPAPPRRGSHYVLTIAFTLAVVAAAVLVSVEVFPAARGPAAPTPAAALAARTDPGLADVTATLGYQQAMAYGTGIVLTPSGRVITNNHVVEGATSITVTDVGNHRTYQATVVGYDQPQDIAVLQLAAASGLKTVSLSTASAVTVGEKVLALGNALGKGGTPVAATGTVTALGQSVTATDQSAGISEQLTGLIQTNVPIQPGDSGGPMVSMAGQVIGMNTAAAASTTGNAPTQNIGFAIPIANIRALIPGLRKGGTVGRPKAFLGVEVVSVTPSERASWALTTTSGALVVSVFPGAPAEVAGIAAGDVIVGFAGRTITTDVALTAAVRGAHPGQRVTIELYRGPTLVTVSLVLGFKPAPGAGSS